MKCIVLDAVMTSRGYTSVHAAEDSEFQLTVYSGKVQQL